MKSGGNQKGVFHGSAPWSQTGIGIGPARIDFSIFNQEEMKR